jgi:hypothetical protein
MLLQKLRLTLSLFIVSLTLVACGGASGDKAAPPVGGITATPGNGQVTIEWTQTPGVEYWLAFAATSSPINISSLQPGHVWATNISSPYVVTGLTNGVTYSFAMNARTGGGPGGAQTPSVSRVPRVAGFAASWVASTTPAGTNALRGLTFDGTNYVAVGDAGSIYKSTDGAAWNSVSGSNTGVNNLGAALYVNSTIGYVVADATNHIYQGTNLATLAVAATATSKINALTTNGATTVAVGDNGLILTSTNGTTWTPATSVPSTANALRGVAVSNGIWVAVGDAGTVFTSSDGATWSVPASYATIANNLRAVAGYGAAFVAVGDSGMVVTSATGSTWTSQQLTLTIGATHPTLYAVNAASGQFLCVGAGGAAFSSPDRTTWTDQTNTLITGDFYALTGSPTAYFAVGAAGLNAVSK